MNRLYNQSEEIFFCRTNQSLELIFLRKPVSAKFYITFTNSFCDTCENTDEFLCDDYIIQEGENFA